MAYQDKDKKQKVRRLIDVEVSHVSLVDRPANRTPFKFVKRDGNTETDGAFPMNITLKNMFGSRPAEVTSVIANTEAKAIAVAKAIMDAGEVVVSETDGVFVARKRGTTASADERAIHLGKAAGVAYTIANLRKELVLYDMEGTDNFDEAVKKEGFVPGLMVGMEALHTTIRNIAMSDKASSAEAFRTGVSKAIADFGTYVDSMIDALPEKAFKFEKAMLAVVAPHLPTGPRPADGFSADIYDMIFGDAAAPVALVADDAAAVAAAAAAAQALADAAPAVVTTDTPAVSVAAAPAAPVVPAAPAVAPVVVAAADPAPKNFEQLPASQTPQTAPDLGEVLREAMGELTKNIGTQIADAVKPLNDRMTAYDANIGKLSKALGSAVASNPDGDDDAGNIIEISKGATQRGGEPPLMDTAYRASRNRG